MTEPIKTTMANWHRHIEGTFEGGLDALIAEDCIFYSPVVFSPQRGKDLTVMYLTAAGATFSGNGGNPFADQTALKDTPFRYVKEIASGHHAALEFETELDGKYINGIDMITCNDQGLITEFKVMVRPLQAINLLHAKMAEMLKAYQAAE